MLVRGMLAVMLVLAGCRKAMSGAYATEAQLALQAIGSGARVYFEQERTPRLVAPGPVSQEFPPSTPLTPEACCETCEVAGDDWNAEGWRAVAFAPTAQFHYRYQLINSGNRFTAKAVRGCPEPTEVWELELVADDQRNVVRTGPRKSL